MTTSLHRPVSKFKQSWTAEDIPDSLDKLLKEEKGCDVLITAGEFHQKAHSFILKLRCPTMDLHLSEHSQSDK